MAEATGLRNSALPYPVYGVPFGVVLPILDADGDLVTGATGLDSEVSKNGDTFADCTNEATEIATSSGTYYLLLTGTEMTADVVTVIVKTSSSGAKTTVLTLYPRKMVSLRAGTAAGGAAGYITLDSGASATDDFYNGALCVAVIDTLTEVRVISDYTGSNKQAAVVPNWNVTPDSDDTFTIYLTDAMQIKQANATAWNGTQVASPATAGIPDVNVKNINNVATTSVTTISAYLGSTGAAINGTNANTLSSHDPGATLGTSTLTQTQVTGGAYALNSASFAFNAALDFTTTQKAATIATVTNLTNAPTSGDFTATMKTSIGTAVAASAVASVTGNVGGNVTGSVGFVASGGIAAASFAAGAIDAAAIANGAIDAATFAADVDAEILSYLVDDATRIDASSLNTATVTTIPAILVDTAEIGAAGAGLTVLATAANLATVAGYLDTEIAAILADTNELQTDWVNGGRLDLILDARASQTSVDDLPTNAELATALGAADDATLAAIAALNNLSAAQVNAEVDTALADIHLDHLLAVTYDPASKPGAADALLNELVESDAGVSRYTANALEQAPSGTGASASAIADEVQTRTIAAVTTVGTTTNLTNLPTIPANWLTAAGTAADFTTEIQSGLATAAALAVVDGIVDDILVDTGTTLQAELDGIQADTEDIQSRIGSPAVSLTADIAALNDVSAADVWANGTRTLTAIDEDSTTLDLDATIRAAIGMASANLDTQLGAIPAATRDVTLTGAASGGIGDGIVAAYTSAAEASGYIQNLLSKLVVATGTAQGGGSSTITLAVGASSTNDLYRNLVIYLTGGTGAGQSAIIASYDGGSKAAIISPSWVVIPDNTTTYALLSLVVPNMDGSGNVRAMTSDGSEIATATALDAVDNFLDTEVAAILADTNELQTDWANGGRLDVILDARASQTSVDDLPTNAELATALGTADDATLAAIAALNNLSAAQVNAEVDTALADYDGPTNAEMVARTIAAASYATAANQTAIEADTQDIQSRLPAALTGAGNIKADALAIDGSTTAATNQKSAALAVYRGTCTSTGTTTTIVDTGLTQVDDHWIGRVVVFLTGTLAYQATTISDFTASSDTLTVVALTSAPQSGDTYLIV